MVRVPSTTLLSWLSTHCERAPGRADSLQNCFTGFKYSHSCLPCECGGTHGGLRNRKTRFNSSIGHFVFSERVRFLIAVPRCAFSKAVRRHRGIETTCHWCLDVTYGEDGLRTRQRMIAENSVWLPPLHFIAFLKTSWQRQPRHETPNLRLERWLPDASPWYQSHLVCVGLAAEGRQSAARSCW